VVVDGGVQVVITTARPVGATVDGARGPAVDTMAAA
jgi:hypothetical protein